MLLSTFDFLDKVSLYLGINPLQYRDGSCSVTRFAIICIFIRLVSIEAVFLSLLLQTRTPYDSYVTSHSVFLVSILRKCLRIMWIISGFCTSLHLLLSKNRIQPAVNAILDKDFPTHLQYILNSRLRNLNLLYTLIFCTIVIIYFPVSFLFQHKADLSFHKYDKSMNINMLFFSWSNLTFATQILHINLQFCVLCAKMDVLYLNQFDILDTLEYFEKFHFQIRKLFKAHAPQIRMNYVFLTILVVINTYYAVLQFDNLQSNAAFYMMIYTMLSSVVSSSLMVWFTMNLNGIQKLVSYLDKVKKPIRIASLGYLQNFKCEFTYFRCILV